ncbi:MAG TPA: hypothetical protein VEK32_13035 [Thermodesulfobacteriota bacterium]|nr:hypothetical protein [Thermodesulfobacteriota bacterium]
MGAMTISTTCGRTAQFSYLSMKSLLVGLNGNCSEIILFHKRFIAMTPEACFRIKISCFCGICLSQGVEKFRIMQAMTI